MTDENKLIIKKNFDNELAKNWKELEKDSNISIFQTYDWNIHWQENCNHNFENITLLYYKKNKLISILPLILYKKYFLKILSWSGFPFSDYNQPLIRNKYTLEKLDFKFLISTLSKKYRFDVIHLINNINNKIFDLSSYKSNKSYKLIYKNQNSYDLIINKFKKKINYEENRLKKKFNYKIYLNPSNDKKFEILNFFVEKKMEQLNRTNAWNYLKIKIFKDYIFKLEKFDQSKISFSCIEVNGKIISSHIGYIFNKNFYYIFPAYDYLYKKFSPGNILLFRLIEFYKSKNFEDFDLTIGEENYKKSFTNYTIDLFDYINCRTLLGLCYMLSVKLKVILKKLIFQKNN